MLVWHKVILLALDHGSHPVGQKRGLAYWLCKIKREISDSGQQQWIYYNTANFSRDLPGQHGSDADHHLTQHLRYL